MPRPPEVSPPAPPFAAWRAVLGVLTLCLVVVTGLLFLGLWNSGWFVQVPREFAPVGMKCAVEMPGGVHESALLPARLADGTQYAARRRFPWESFGLAARELPDDFDADADDPLPAMDRLLGEFFQTLPGGLAPAAETVPDANALVRQASATTAKYGNVVARVVHGGPRLYLLVAAGKSVTLARPDVEGFFRSFRGTDDDERATAAAALARSAGSGTHRDAWQAFDRQTYGGPAVANPTVWAGLTHHWRCDGSAGRSWADARGGADATWRAAPASAEGVRGAALAFGNAAALTANFPRPVTVFPRRVSTLTFWYRATPGDGRLLDLHPDHDTEGSVDLVGGEVVFHLPASPKGRPREVKLPRPADADWHHVALVRRADPEPAGTQLWFDGELAFEGPPTAADTFDLATTRVGVGGPAGGLAKPSAGDFRAALDEVCLFARSLSDPEIRQLAAAPEPPAGDMPYWLRPDTGLPKPLAYLAWDPATARTGSLPDAAARRAYRVNGPVTDADAPAGRGYAFTPKAGDPAVDFGAWRFVPLARNGVAPKPGEVAPFTAAIWACYDGATPLELLALGDLRLTLTATEARVALTATGPPAFISAALAPGWHHYTLTRGRTGVVRFYLDGVGVPGAFEVSGTDDRSPHPIRLGTFAAGSKAKTFQVSEMVIFSNVVTAAQARRVASVKVVE